MTTGAGGTGGDSSGLVRRLPPRANVVSRRFAGETLVRALKAANIWEKKMGLVARQHDNTVAKATLDEWIRVEAAWQEDHSKEDPYAEPELGMFFFLPFLRIVCSHFP
jgi:hypothetical protein